MKYIKSVNLFIVVCFLLLIVSCEKSVVEYVEVESPRGSVQLSSNKVEIGQKLTANFTNMDSSDVYAVSLNQKEVTFSQIDDKTVTVIVPYTNVGNDVGNFIFYSWMQTNSFFPDTVLVSNQINYKYENSPFGPYVKWNSNEKIVHDESLKFDGFSNGWSLQTENDTLKIIRTYTCHDECSITEILAFKDNGNNNLPQFLYALYKRREWMKDPIDIKIISRCKITIDEWNNTSIYSGIFSSEGYSWVFWCEE